MLIVLAPFGLLVAAIAARAIWRAWQAVPKHNADFGIV